MKTFDVFLAAYFWIILFSGNVIIIHATIGITWGRQARTEIVPSMVIDILLQNQVKAVRIMCNDDDIIMAFSGTSIDLTITVLNTTITIKNMNDAREFVRQKIIAYPTVNFKYVVLQTDTEGQLRPEQDLFSRSKEIDKLIDAVQFLQTALDDLGYGHIKVTTTITDTVYGMLPNILKPSQAKFFIDAKMRTLFKIVNQTKAPIFIDFSPTSFMRSMNLDLNFKFFDNKSTYVVNDVNGLVYRNAFEFMYDSFLWAIKKLGYEDLKIVVGKVGWPTDGYSDASLENAERFWRGMLPLAASNRGTPLRPGIEFDIYVHTISDENWSTPYVRYQRHLGIYRSNGVPKYKIDLSGQGRDLYPPSIRGINLMPERWCVFNNDYQNEALVEAQRKKACDNADCSAIGESSSCLLLTREERISYAFNAYFQSNYQNERTCTFAGLGRVTTSNPSRDGCVFSIEVVKYNKDLVKSSW